MKTRHLLAPWIAALALAVGGAQAAELQSVAVHKQPRTVWRAFDGVVEAVNQSTVSAQTSGQIKAINYDVHDYVPAGAVLIQIDDTEQQARLRRARAQLAEAQAGAQEADANFRRVSRMYGSKLVSRADYDKAKAAKGSADARLKAAQASVKEAERQLSYTRVTAPFAGIVMQRHVEVGEAVRPGQALMTGLSLDQLRVNVEIPQQYAVRVRKADRARVVLPDGSRHETGELTFYPFADPQTHDFRVRVKLNGEGSGLYPGMFLNVEVPVGQSDALMVPKEAVLYRSELRAVYVLDDQGRPHLRQVRLGSAGTDGVEILSGLSSGERVALNPLAAMEAAAEIAAEGKGS